MSKDYSHDLQSARSTLRRWIWKNPETDDRLQKVIAALELLDSLDIPETIDISPVIQSVNVAGLLFEVV